MSISKREHRTLPGQPESCVDGERRRNRHRKRPVAPHHPELVWSEADTGRKSVGSVAALVHLQYQPVQADLHSRGILQLDEIRECSGRTRKTIKVFCQNLVKNRPGIGGQGCVGKAGCGTAIEHNSRGCAVRIASHRGTLGSLCRHGLALDSFPGSVEKRDLRSIGWKVEIQLVHAKLAVGPQLEKPARWEKRIRAVAHRAASDTKGDALQRNRVVAIPVEQFDPVALPGKMFHQELIDPEFCLGSGRRCDIDRARGGLV